MRLSFLYSYNFFLLSLIPLLLIYSFNVGEIPINDLYVPFFISIGISGLFFLLFKLKFNSTQSGVIISTCLISFISFGYINSFFESNFLNLTIILVIIFLFLAIFSLYQILKHQISKEINKIFTIFSVVLIIILIPNILLFYFNDNFLENENFDIDLNLKFTDHPDIYIIILDEFAGELQLNNDFNYSLEPFFQNLTSYNFQFPKNSLSNYPNTAYSLPSILNMDYLEFIPKKVGAESKNTLMAYELRNDNNFMKILKNNDYEIISFYGGMGASGTGSLVHEKHCAPLNINNDLKEKYLKIFIPFSIFNNELINNPLNEKLECIQNYVIAHERNSQPESFFIHLRLPHSPYLYDSNGNFNKNSNFLENDKNAYLEQLKFTEKYTTQLVSSITKNNPDAYIVLFSDHGWRGEINWKEQSPENLIRGHSVILGYRIPDNELNLPDNTSLVNTFRILINQISNTELELLDDKFYWYDVEKPNEHYDVSLKILNFLD